MNKNTFLAIAGLNLATILVVVLLLRFTVARANPDVPQATSVPGAISYQGYLTDGSGDPLGNDQDGENVHLRFTIYAGDVPNNDDLWQEDHVAVLVKDGYFQVMLGKATPFTNDVFGQPQRWLQVTMVNGSTETHLPRQQFAAAPYAIQAQYAASAASAASVPWSGLTGNAVALGCRVYQAQGVPITGLASMPPPGYQLVWSNKISDTANCWTSGEKLVIPVNGYYTAGANVGFSVEAADGGKRVNLALARFNVAGVLQEYLGNQTIYAQTGTINYLNTNVSMFYATAGDYVVAVIGGNTTGTLTVSAVGTPVPPATSPSSPHYQSAWLARIP